MSRHQGQAVNPWLPAPQPPGPWITEERCRCGAEYRRHRTPGLCWASARAELRARGVEYISRGPVLWAMRVSKLFDWYLAHDDCQPGERPAPLPAWTPTAEWSRACMW